MQENKHKNFILVIPLNLSKFKPLDLLTYVPPPLECRVGDNPPRVEAS